MAHNLDLWCLQIQLLSFDALSVQIRLGFSRYPVLQIKRDKRDSLG